MGSRIVFLGMLMITLAFRCTEETSVQYPQIDFTINSESGIAAFVGKPSISNTADEAFVEVRKGQPVVLHAKDARQWQWEWKIDGYTHRDLQGRYSHTFYSVGIKEVSLCYQGYCKNKLVKVVDPSVEEQTDQEPIAIIAEPVNIEKKEELPEPRVFKPVPPEIKDSTEDQRLSDPESEVIPPEEEPDTISQPPVPEMKIDTTVELRKTGKLAGVLAAIDKNVDTSCFNWLDKATVRIEAGRVLVLREVVVYSSGIGKVRLTWSGEAGSLHETTTVNLIPGWTQLSLSDLYSEINVPLVAYNMLLEVIEGDARIADASSCANFTINPNDAPLDISGPAILFNLKLDY